MTRLLAVAGLLAGVWIVYRLADWLDDVLEARRDRARIAAALRRHRGDPS